MIEFFGRGGALKPSWYGDCLPSRDFPMLIDLYLQGRLDLDRFCQRDDRARPGRGSVPPHGARRGAALGRGAVTAMPLRSIGSSPAGSSASTARISRSTTTSGWSATTAEVVVIDAAHDAAPIVAAIGGRKVEALICTHGHNDHINAAAALAERWTRRSGCIPTTRCCGTSCTPTDGSTAALRRRRHRHVAGAELTVSTRRVTRRADVASPAERRLAVLRRHVVQRRSRRDRAVVFGPGDAGGQHPRRLFGLPDATIVNTGHGDSTTIGAERSHVA